MSCRGDIARLHFREDSTRTSVCVAVLQCHPSRSLRDNPGWRERDLWIRLPFDVQRGIVWSASPGDSQSVLPAMATTQEVDIGKQVLSQEQMLQHLPEFSLLGHTGQKISIPITASVLRTFCTNHFRHAIPPPEHMLCCR